jgi:hypothetical protein
MSIFTKIRTSLERFGLGHIGYFDGDLYQFSETADKGLVLVKANTTFSPYIIIVSRAFYSERCCELPFEERKQVREYLKLERSAESKLASRVTLSEQGITYYNQWLFSAAVPQATFVFPETALYAVSSGKNELLMINNTIPLYVLHNDKGVYSAMRSKMIVNSAYFLSAVGGGCNQERTIETHEWILTLYKTVFNAPIDLWAACYRSPNNSRKFITLKRFFTPIVTLTACYLAFTSVYLLGAKYYVSNQLNEQQVKVTESLSNLQNLDESIARFKALKAVSSELKSHADFLLLMAELFPTAEFTNIRTKGERYVIRGKVNKATDLLKRLIEHDAIIDAKFDFPVRRGRDKDVFVISFAMKSQGVTNG